MDESLSAHEYALRKVFSSDYEFEIPEYQRPYRWGADQVLQLLDDLEEALDRDDEEPYFLGSLVLVKRGAPRFEVIDGQQRLTTLSILFAVLRDLAAKENIAIELGNLVLEPGSELDGIASKPRLTLRDWDADFFRDYVQQRGRIGELLKVTDATATTEPQRAIRDNAAVLYRRLQDWEDDRRNKLATLMRTRTYLVVVSTRDINSAYRIFSVLNARGLDLAPADIFKSTVVGKLCKDSPEAKRWEAAEEALGSDEFNELFRDIRTIVSGERARLELLREFPEQVLKPYLKDGGSPTQFVEGLLLPYAKAFGFTLTQDIGGGSTWRCVNDWLSRLAMIDNKDWRPVALWAMVQHPDDPTFLAALLRRLERLAAMFLLTGEYSTPRVLRYLDVLRDLKDGSGVDAPALQLTAEEKVRAQAALNGDIYRLQAKRARYVMLRLDELLSNDAGVKYDHTIISIEHVLPQNPSADSEWVSTFTPEERSLWTNKLGNLLLLNRRKNAQANNRDFAFKKAHYFTTSTGSAVFALTTQVLGYSEWKPSTVEQRQAELVSVLRKEWELD